MSKQRTSQHKVRTYMLFFFTGVAICLKAQSRIAEHAAMLGTKPSNRRGLEKENRVWGLHVQRQTYLISLESRVHKAGCLNSYRDSRPMPVRVPCSAMPCHVHTRAPHHSVNTVPNAFAEFRRHNRNRQRRVSDSIYSDSN